MDEMNYAVETARQELTDRIKDLPITLSASDVAGILGICLTTAYKLIAHDEFPKVKMSGVRRVIIPKARFIEWYIQATRPLCGEPRTAALPMNQVVEGTILPTSTEPMTALQV